MSRSTFVAGNSKPWRHAVTMGNTWIRLLKDSIYRLRALITNRICIRSPVDQIRIETKWVDRLQRKLENGNSTVLKNFKLKLVLDEEECGRSTTPVDTTSHSHASHECYTRFIDKLPNIAVQSNISPKARAKRIRPLIHLSSFGNLLKKLERLNTKSELWDQLSSSERVLLEERWTCTC